MSDVTEQGSGVAQGVMIDGKPLAAFMSGAGYPLTALGDQTWRTYCQGTTSAVPLLIRAAEGYVTFAIVPFVSTPEDDALASALYARLLVLNHQLFMAKFSIDDDLDVMLSVEYPTSQLDASEVLDSLSALSHYAAEHRDALRAHASGENP